MPGPTRITFGEMRESQACAGGPLDLDQLDDSFRRRTLSGCLYSISHYRLEATDEGDLVLAIHMTRDSLWFTLSVVWLLIIMGASVFMVFA
jgi:hypothetical protein